MMNIILISLLSNHYCSYSARLLHEIHRLVIKGVSIRRRSAVREPQKTTDYRARLIQEAVRKKTKTSMKRSTKLNTEFSLGMRESTTIDPAESEERTANLPFKSYYTALYLSN